MYDVLIIFVGGTLCGEFKSIGLAFLNIAKIAPYLAYLTSLPFTETIRANFGILEASSFLVNLEMIAPFPQRKKKTRCYELRLREVKKT